MSRTCNVINEHNTIVTIKKQKKKTKKKQAAGKRNANISPVILDYNQTFIYFFFFLFSLFSIKVDEVRTGWPFRYLYTYETMRKECL